MRLIGPAVVSFAAVLCAGHTRSVPDTAVHSQLDGTRAYSADDYLYLVTRRDSDSVRIGVKKPWGVAIVEISYDGENVVNAYDVGRAVQAALYDGNDRYDQCSGCTGVWGWDPVQGGDRHGSGGMVSASSIRGDTLYVQTRALQWAPENFGGGVGHPIPADVTVEQWIAPIPGYWNAFRVRYRVTHFGADSHANSAQELPVVYVNRGYDTPVLSDDHNSLVRQSLPEKSVGESLYYAPKRWMGFANNRGVGLAVSMLGQYPYFTVTKFSGDSGPNGRGANYLRPYVPYTFLPGTKVDATMVLVVGNISDAPGLFTQLLGTEKRAGGFPPFGYLDSPEEGQSLRGQFAVAGWFIGDSSNVVIDMLLDGKSVGIADGRQRRPDVEARYPNGNVQSGFIGHIDGNAFTEGLHVLQVRLRDQQGHVSLLRSTKVRITH